VGGGFSGGLSEGAAGVVVGGLGRVGYRRQDGVRLALLFLERQYSHVELRANSIWLGKGQYLTLFFVSIYISRYNLEADKQPLVYQPAARRSHIKTSSQQSVTNGMRLATCNATMQC
jgi:hypothetical protein